MVMEFGFSHIVFPRAGVIVNASPWIMGNIFYLVVLVGQSLYRSLCISSIFT